MLQLFSSLLVLTLSVALLLVSVRAGDQEKEVKALKQELPLHDCSKPDPGSRRHVDWINKLNGRRIVFAGDSPLRFQYLSLGYYLAHGQCPDAENGPDIMSEEAFDTWEEFFQETSAALSVKTDAYRTLDVCMCHRKSKQPYLATEQRTFTYQDVQGRRVELVYLQYITETIDPLSAVLGVADSYKPTDVVISFGEEMKATDGQCGMTQDNTGTCPYLPWFCWYLKAWHPFKVWWLPAMPTTVNDQIEDHWYTSHLNLYHRCMLEFAQVMDRRAAIAVLQPKKAKQPALYNSNVNVKANVNHAINWQLLRRLDDPSDHTVTASSHSSRMWKQILGS